MTVGTMSNIKDWTQLSADALLDSTQDRTQWQRVVTEESVCARNDNLCQAIDVDVLK